MLSNVLVLNHDFSPLSVCSSQRAFVLVYLNKADLLHAYEDRSLRSTDDAYPCPSVIKIKKYVSKPYRGVMLTRFNVFRRDNHMCQYCGSTKNLTIDHVIPRAKGGKTTWKNVITACESCNFKKGDKDLEHCGLNLAFMPTKPSPFLNLTEFGTTPREEWRKYLN